MGAHWVLRRILVLLIALVLAGDAAAIVVLRQEAAPAADPAVAPTRLNVTTTVPPRSSSVLFRDDFSSATVFEAGEDDSSVTTIDGQFRLRLTRDRDLYRLIPPWSPDRARVEQAQDVSVAVDVQNVSGGADDWFGVVCRTKGLGSDLYLGQVHPDGAWAIYRVTISTPYVRRRLVGGRTPDLFGVQPADFVFRIRLDCIGAGATALHLYVNDHEVGLATDPDGLGPANAGIAASSTTGEFAFDNLVVTGFS